MRLGSSVLMAKPVLGRQTPFASHPGNAPLGVVLAPGNVRLHSTRTFQRPQLASAPPPAATPAAQIARNRTPRAASAGISARNRAGSKLKFPVCWDRRPKPPRAVPLVIVAHQLSTVAILDELHGPAPPTTSLAFKKATASPSPPDGESGPRAPNYASATSRPESVPGVGGQDMGSRPNRRAGPPGVPAGG